MALTERGEQHAVYCEQCGKEHTVETPGATARFHSFLGTHAPEAALKKSRDKMYALRSGILHGGKLTKLDQDSYFGFHDPADLDESELHRELWGITRIALRDWLKNSAAPAAPKTKSTGLTLKAGGKKPTLRLGGDIGGNRKV